jgi:hypothetical protein
LTSTFHRWDFKLSLEELDEELDLVSGELFSMLPLYLMIASAVVIAAGEPQGGQVRGNEIRSDQRSAISRQQRSELIAEC